MRRTNLGKVLIEPYSPGFNLGRISFRGWRVKTVSDLTAFNALDLERPCILVLEFTGHWLARFHSKELHFLTRIDGVIRPATRTQGARKEFAL
jgi:hypothetical protein